MNRRLLLTTLTLAVSAIGCSQDTSEGIWAFYLGAMVTETDSNTLSHNFDGAYEPSSSDWTTSGDITESEAIVYGEMVTLSNGEDLLVVQNQTYLGATVESTTTWTWDHYSEGNLYESHEQGYAFTQDWSDHTLDQIALTESDTDGVLTGSWTRTSTTDDQLNEDDTWDAIATGQSTSQVPSTSYLVVSDEFDNETPASNSAIESNCTGDPCTLSVSTKLVETRSVKAVLTDYTADDLDRNLEISGQQAGN